jgi:uncharacterized protein YneF (UPF0154 family)
MPLKKGSSAKIMKANISELVTSKPGAARKKAIKTMVKKTGMTPKQAKIKQAVAISYAKARQSKKK